MADCFFHFNSYFEHGVDKTRINDLTRGLPRLQNHLHPSGATWQVVSRPTLEDPLEKEHIPLPPKLVLPGDLAERRVIPGNMTYILDVEGYINHIGHESPDAEPLHGTPLMLFTYSEEYVRDVYPHSSKYQVIGMGPIATRWQVVRAVTRQRLLFEKFLHLSSKMTKFRRWAFFNNVPLPKLQRIIARIPHWGAGYIAHQGAARAKGQSWMARMRTGPGIRILCSGWYCHHMDPEVCTVEGLPVSSCNQCKKILQVAEAGFVETATFVKHTRADLRDDLLARMSPLVCKAFAKTTTLWIQKHLKRCNHLDHAGEEIPYRGGWIIGGSGLPLHRIRDCYTRHAQGVSKSDTLLLQHARRMVAEYTGHVEELLLSHAMYLSDCDQVEIELDI